MKIDYPNGDVPLEAFCQARPSGKPLAILLGSEGDGLGTAARAEADVGVSIPMAPGEHSLNVAVACAIGLHRLAPA